MEKYERILLATDFSEQARKALVEAVRLARRHSAQLHVLHVDVLASQGAGSFDAPAIPEYIRLMNSAAADPADDLTYANTVVKVLRDSSEAPGILRYARELDIDLIVLGTHGRGPIAELLFGSVAQAVVRDAVMPVLVVGPGQVPVASPAPCILAPVDFTHPSRLALQAAARIAVERTARLIVLNVVDFGRVAHPEEMEIGERERRAREEIERFVGNAALPLAAETVVTIGPAADDIVRIAGQRQASLIVMAASSHSPLQRLLIGSVCKSVIRATPCPVLVYREHARSVRSVAA